MIFYHKNMFKDFIKIVSEIITTLFILTIVIPLHKLGLNFNINISNDLYFIFLLDNNNIKVLKHMLDNGLDPNTVIDDYNRNITELTLLNMCIVRNHAEILQLLLDYRADPNIYRKMDNTRNMHPLELACWYGGAMVDPLLKSGANVMLKCKNGNTVIADIFNNIIRGDRHFISDDVIYKLIDAIPNINDYVNRSNTILRYTCKYKHVSDIVKYILEKPNVDVNIKNLKGGKTALHAAVYGDDVELVECLLNNGANVNAKSCYDGTSLHIAAMYGNIKVIKLLVKHGANINALDFLYRTPPMIAYIYDNHEVRHYLRSLVGRYTKPARRTLTF